LLDLKILIKVSEMMSYKETKEEEPSTSGPNNERTFGGWPIEH
jgi:hypothetical protein